MKIGIYGGGFNPVTIAHLDVMAAAADYVDRLWVMPVTQHPWDKELVPLKHRWEMLEMAVGDIRRNRRKIWVREGNDGTTIDLITRLNRDRNLDDSYSVVIGSDNAEQIEKWTEYQRLCIENNFIIVLRGGEVKIDPALFHGSTIIVDKFCTDAPSATDLRKAIMEKRYKDAARITTPDVVEYIRKHRLYK